MIQKTLIGLAVLTAIFAIVIATRPDDFRITRATTIAAPPATVFAQVNDLHLWDAWSPWAKLDPECKVTFSGAAAGKGAEFHWAGNSEVGEGHQTITESTPSQLVRMKLDFIKPFKASNDVEFTFQPDATGTVVTWTMSGKNNFLGKAFSLVMDCETMLGPQFEKGLASLKAVSEAAPKP